MLAYVRVMRCIRFTPIRLHKGVLHSYCSLFWARKDLTTAAMCTIYNGFRCGGMRNSLDRWHFVHRQRGRERGREGGWNPVAICQLNRNREEESFRARLLCPSLLHKGKVFSRKRGANFKAGGQNGKQH